MIVDFSFDEFKKRTLGNKKQGREQYVSGNYELGKLDKHGQHISVRVKIARKDKSETVSFITGWMICPKGKIQLITPYGGK